jgi:hypothetical protein
VPVPLLTTTRTRQDVGKADPSLHNPNVAVLFGDGSFDYPALNGVRVAIGLAPPGQGDIGAEVSGFYLPAGSRGFLFQTDGKGAGALILPFRNTTRPAAVDAGVPVGGLVSGKSVPAAATISSKAELWGAEAWPSLRVWEQGGFAADALAGFRLLGLKENLRVQTRSQNGTETFETSDLFETKNYFYGLELGGRLAWARDAFTASLNASVAPGVVGESIEGVGSTLRPASAVKRRPGPALVNGGFFTFNRNGRVKHTRFSVVPEVGVNAAYQLTDAISLRAGYSFLYASTVLRATEQVAPNFSRSALPLFGGNFSSLPDPIRDVRESSFWAHGLNAGLEVQY